MKNSFHTLEFDRVLPLIGKYLKTYAGKTRLDKIRPYSEPEKVKEELDIVKQMSDFLKYDGSLMFEETDNIESSVKNAGIEGYVLGVDEVLEIKKTLEIWKSNADSIRSTVNANRTVKYPLLADIVERVPVNDDLIHKLGRIMDNNGNIFDGASEELKRIRKRKSSVRLDIQNKLSSIMDRDNFRDVIQDRIITIRDGRFVIPIRSQHRNKARAGLNYIVHSFSNSGETSFVEPQEVLYLNNELMEIDEIELIEIRKILRELTWEIGIQCDKINNVAQALGTLEFIYARAKFAIEFRCGFPEIIGRPASLKLVNAYHPLLGRNAVPISIEAGFSYRGIIISGPNAGGKTVALKTAGLLLLMTLCGIPVTADSDSKIGIFTGIMAEIGDEQSISENLSSFSGHIKNIAAILKECNQNSLILIDEIAGSTEPKEGEAIGREIIRFLLEKGAKFIVTTHYQGIKELAFSDSRVRNAFVEFDEDKFIPLYRLHIGGTGSSFALKAAKKYGLEEGIVKGAESYLVRNYTESEKILKELETDKNILFKKIEIAEKNIRESRRIKEFYEGALKKIEEEKRLIDKKGTVMLRKELDEALKEVSSIKKDMKIKGGKDIKDIDRRVEEVRQVLQSAETGILKAEKKHPAEILTGQSVFVGSLQKEGYVEEAAGVKIKVRLGILSVFVDRDDIYVPEAGEEEMENRRFKANIEINIAPFLIDIRGKSLEEAMKIVEKNLDYAVVSGMQMIQIIHGKGEGVLRKAVWEFLKRSDSVKNFQFAKPEEGGQGKTIVILK